MLVLSRKIGEKIHVGNDITIEVRRVAGNRVTLAVEAPREVRILRGELHEAAMAFKPTQAELPAPAETLVLNHTHVLNHTQLGAMASMPHVIG